MAVICWLLALSWLGGCAAPPEHQIRDHEQPVSAAAAGDRPSLLLVTLDTTRADRLGAFGSDRGLTPHLDRLADSGVVFETTFAQAAVTPVSHASIMTGLDPFHHGLRVMHGTTENRLADEVQTAAEILGSAGYATAAFVSAFPVSERFGFEQGFARFDDEFRQAPGAQTVAADGTVNTGLVQRRAGETTDLALEWLSTAPRPFFLWVHYFDPHDSLLQPPAEFLEIHAPLPAAERDRLRAIYDIEVAYMDQELGRLLDSVRASEARSGLMISVISDHGEGLGDHDWWTHGILYQEQIRVPFIWWETGGGPRRVKEWVRSIDLLPTWLDRLEIDAPPMDGRSLLPLIRGEEDWSSEPAYADSINLLTYAVHPEIRDVKDDMLFAVARPPWKYIHHLAERDRQELYDLESDPRELVNLYGQRPEVALSFQRLLHGLDPMPELVTGRRSMLQTDRERLRALGYLD